MAKDKNTGWPDKGQWRTARGKLLRIRRMDDRHLEATQRWLRRVFVNHRATTKAWTQLCEEEGRQFGDGFKDEPIATDLWIALLEEGRLLDKLAEFDAELKRRKGLLYRLTHRKRSEPQAILSEDRTVLLRF